MSRMFRDFECGSIGDDCFVTGVEDLYKRMIEAGTDESFPAEGTFQNPLECMLMGAVFDAVGQLVVDLRSNDGNSS